MNFPWINDLLKIDLPAKLTCEEFVAAYLPQYVNDYRPPEGIRLNAKGRCIMSSAGSVKAQITKRSTRINNAYALYLRHYDEAKEIVCKKAE